MKIPIQREFEGKGYLFQPMTFEVQGVVGPSTKFCQLIFVKRSEMLKTNHEPAEKFLGDPGSK